MIRPDEVRSAAEKMEDNNYRFRRFLKNRADSGELDQQFLRLHNELFAAYDCSQCRNCCQQLGTSLSDEEITAIAAFLGISKQEFIETYLTAGIDGLELKAPCRFLGTKGDCELEACKPISCRDFPYTNRPDRLSSSLSILSFAEVCPVVFEILERLKEIYGFRNR